MAGYHTTVNVPIDAATAARLERARKLRQERTESPVAKHVIRSEALAAGSIVLEAREEAATGPDEGCDC